MLKRIVKFDCWAPAVLLLALGASPCLAQELPISDGAYLSNEECDKAERGEIDMIGFMVEKNGRAITMHESGCLVSEIKPVRKNRYDVELDCREVDEIYQYQFFLDVISDQHVRVDGDDLWICKKGFLATETTTLAPAESADNLIAAWADADENCAGGSGDNPATEAACTLRQQLAEKLNQKDLCFGREKQSRNGYDWHQCDAGSLR